MVLVMAMALLDLFRSACFRFLFQLFRKLAKAMVLATHGDPPPFDCLGLLFFESSTSNM
jgi:hypothetical protein